MAEEIKVLRQSSNRDFIQYVLSKSWKYIGTFSFSDYEIRRSLNCLFLWNDFCRSIKKINKDFRSVAIIEQDHQGEFYLIVLMDNVELCLDPIKNVRTGELVYSSIGDQVFTSPVWKFGYNTLTLIDSESVKDVIVWALSKYHQVFTDFIYIENGDSKYEN